MTIDEGIRTLENQGLNIFLSAKVSELPLEILSTFTNEQKNKTLCLIGHGGKKLWECLPHPIELKENPIDQYSLKQVQWFAKNVLSEEVEILFPNDQYTIPLQKIGRFFNYASLSPIGIDISKEYGLWFAYRALFLTDKKIPRTSREVNLSPCKSCQDKPCLQTTKLSQARINCPEKKQHQYSQDQQTYHQKILTQFYK